MEARKQPTHVPNFWQSFEWRELYKKKNETAEMLMYQK